MKWMLFFILFLLLPAGVSSAHGLTVWPENDADDADTFATGPQHFTVDGVYEDLAKNREAERELERQNLEAIEALPFHGNFSE